MKKSFDMKFFIYALTEKIIDVKVKKIQTYNNKFYMYFFIAIPIRKHNFFLIEC